MVSIKLLITLLVVLSCLMAQTSAKKSCTLTISLQQTDTASKYNTYSATVTNIGSTSVSNIILTPSDTVRSVTGLTSSGSTYTPSVSSLAPSATYSFSYTVKKSLDLKWTASCSASASTAAPTKAASTAAPTKAASTAAPTTKASTAAPTTAPSKAASTAAPSNTGGTVGTSGGKKCSSGWWRPAPGTTWQWQLTGTVDTSLDVQMYDIDLFDASSSLISALHASGKVVICYFSTQYENWRPDASSFPSSILGSNLDDWVGEKYVDIRSSTLRDIMATRLDLAVSKGCDGVEPDNVDGYQASTGFPLTANDQLDYNKWFANAAHTRGLSVGLKNDGDQAAALQPYFDWALNEQCNQYSECTALNTFINAGKAVFNCEYSGTASSVCPKMVTAKFSTLFKALALDASIKSQCCTYASGGCATKAAFTCVTAKRSLVEDEEVQAVQEEIQEVAEEIQEEPVAMGEEAATDSKMNSAATACASFITLAGAVAALSLLL